MRARLPSLPFGLTILIGMLVSSREAHADGVAPIIPTDAQPRTRSIGIAIEVAPITAMRSVNRGIAATFLLTEVVVYLPRLRYGTAYIAGGYGPIVALPAYFVGRAGVELSPMGAERSGMLLLVGGRYVRLFGRMPEPYRTDTLDQGTAYGPLGELGVGYLLPGKHRAPTVRVSGVGLFGPLTYEATDAVNGTHAVHREPSFGGELSVSVSVL